MRFSYRLIRDRRGYLAECLEAEAAGEGKTAAEAVESLRALLHERMFRPDAVAPPSATEESTIELVLTEDGQSGSTASA
ncbi:MAG: hypothetical protein KIT84_02320 [Labilithrix sp.]|nr:hypothetical protein [Labilithrix sp.]MCW5809820.1 hypothetical protein [Labilithrix sp.]